MIPCFFQHFAKVVEQAFANFNHSGKANAFIVLSTTKIAAMYSSQSCVFAVNHHARALAPQKASKERHRFLVGTCSLHDSNELSVLEYHENSNQIEASAIYNHPDQIWAVEPSPNESDLVITSSQSSSNNKALTLYRMPHQKEEDLQDESILIEDKLELIEESTYEVDNNTIIQNIKWHPSQEKMLTADSNGIGLWDITSKVSLLLIFCTFWI
jgi:hypothetical protein